MRANSDIIAAGAQGDDDRSLSQNGHDRYRHNVRDMMTLLVKTRNDHVSFKNCNRTPNLSEGHLPLRSNDQRLLVTNPHHRINFANYFSADVDKIVGNGGDYTQFAQREMPHQIIIPLGSGGYCRTIIVQIHYVKEIVDCIMG